MGAMYPQTIEIRGTDETELVLLQKGEQQLYFHTFATYLESVWNIDLFLLPGGRLK
jgi:hypothetical protein